MTAQDIKRLMKKRSLTGEEVGKALILDTIETFRSVRDTGKTRPLFSQQDLDQMVEGIRSVDQGEMYNTYVSLLNFIQKSQALSVSYKQEAESGYYRLLLMLERVRASELVLSLEDHLDLSRDPGSLVFLSLGGNGLDWIAEDPDTQASLKSARRALLTGLRGCFAHNTLFALIAERIDIPDFTIFQTNCEQMTQDIGRLNETTDWVGDHLPGDRAERAKKRRLLRRFFPSIQMEEMSPSQGAILEVKSQIQDLSVFRNINVQLTQRLMQEDGEEERRAQ